MLDKMEELGITQKAVAERMGCSQQYISRVLKGSENLSIETIFKIESALDCRFLNRHSPCVKDLMMLLNAKSDLAIEYDYLDRDSIIFQLDL